MEMFKKNKNYCDVSEIRVLHFGIRVWFSKNVFDFWKVNSSNFCCVTLMHKYVYDYVDCCWIYYKGVYYFFCNVYDNLCVNFFRIDLVVIVNVEKLGFLVFDLEWVSCFYFNRQTSFNHISLCWVSNWGGRI